MKQLILLISTLLVLVSSQAIAENGHHWYYSRTEVDNLYEIHYNREGRLENHIHEGENRKYIAELQYDRRVLVPPGFIQHTLLHLWLAIENGWVNYIFWPDLNHGHLFVPIELWEKNYIGNGDKFNDQMTDLLGKHMDQLGILYHAAEHFCRNDPANTKAMETRNVVGWFDGRPIELTYPDPKEAPIGRLKANTADEPKGYRSRWFISVSASKNGFFAIYPNGKEIRLDISFDNRDIYDSTTYPRKKSKNGDWRL